MSGISEGVSSLTNAFKEVNKLSTENALSINHMSEEVGKFKVEKDAAEETAVSEKKDSKIVALLKKMHIIRSKND
jgi:hypothetical protein